MYEKIDLIFTRKGLCNTIEELRLASKKSGFVKMDEIEVDIWSEGGIAYIDPYKNIEHLAPVSDCKSKLNMVKSTFPFDSNTLDKFYKKPREITNSQIDGLVIRWPTLSEVSDSWDYHKFEIFSYPLCNSYTQVKKTIENKEMYNSKKCNTCQNQIKNYCKDINSIINKNSLPKEIKFKFMGENR